jgi:hypothetical protein
MKVGIEQAGHQRIFAGIYNFRAFRFLELPLCADSLDTLAFDYDCGILQYRSAIPIDERAAINDFGFNLLGLLRITLLLHLSLLHKVASIDRALHCTPQLGQPIIAPPKRYPFLASGAKIKIGIPENTSMQSYYDRYFRLQKLNSSENIHAHGS